MKLIPYQICRWCDAALHGRRVYLTLAAAVLLLALAVALRLAWLMLPPLLLAGAALALYQLHRHYAFGDVYQRKPRPQDALCETILIDAALIGQGTRLRAAAQPIDVADTLSLRLGSGTLLLGAAMVHTADALPRADRAAILSAVQALNIKPSRLRSHSPVVSREDGPLTAVTVKDGMNFRRYYTGTPEELAARCTAIWEGNTRPMSEHDRTRIADTARYIAQGSCRVIAWATALEEEDPVFLGMAGVGEEVSIHALQDVASLRGRGLTMMLDPGDQPDTDLDALRALLELPDHHARPDLHLSARDVGASPALGITCLPGESLLEPVTTLIRHFRTIEDTLRRFCLLLMLPLAAALLNAVWPAALIATLLMLYAAIALGVDLTCPRPRVPALLGICVAVLVAKAFLLTLSDPLALMGGGIIAVSTAAGCAIRLCGQAFALQGASLKRCLPVIIAAVISVLGFVLFALPAGITLLLPLGFAALISAAIILLLCFEQVIFK